MSHCCMFTSKLIFFQRISALEYLSHTNAKSFLFNSLFFFFQNHCFFWNLIYYALSIKKYLSCSEMGIPQIVFRRTKTGFFSTAPSARNPTSTMVCRIRRYRGLTSGFRINNKVVTYMPFLLKFFFKNVNEENGQVIYLVIRATPVFSAFKSKFSTAFYNVHYPRFAFLADLFCYLKLCKKIIVQCIFFCYRL